RMKGISEGAGTRELGEWMREYGSEVAINLDGGGSTTLFVADGKGGIRRLTTSKVYRKVAAPLGIFRIKEDTADQAGQQ
ncbi:MAG: phosphodiester glycosidase family protein, partial [Lentisphaeria bacterium]|nr:phosphodiester glycosidase family protein [Lentisphaeria bacterium]